MPVAKKAVKVEALFSKNAAKVADCGLEEPQVVDSKKAVKKPVAVVVTDDRWRKLARRLAVEVGWSDRELKNVFGDGEEE